MEGVMIRGWNHMLSGWRWVYIRAPANQQSAIAVAVFTPCGVVWTRGLSVFPGVSEMQTHGHTYDPGMGTHSPRLAEP